MSKYETRKRKGRVIPFGYKQSPDDPKLLLPIASELDALRDALFYLRTCSYRQVANWLFKKTGRYISDVGLLNTHKAWQKAQHKVYYENKKRKQKIEKSQELERRFNATFAQSQEERKANSISGSSGKTGTEGSKSETS